MPRSQSNVSAAKLAVPASASLRWLQCPGRLGQCPSVDRLEKSEESHLCGRPTNNRQSTLVCMDQADQTRRSRGFPCISVLASSTVVFAAFRGFSLASEEASPFLHPPASTLRAAWLSKLSLRATQSISCSPSRRPHRVRPSSASASAGRRPPLPPAHMTAQTAQTAHCKAKAAKAPAPCPCLLHSVGSRVSRVCTA